MHRDDAFEMVELAAVGQHRVAINGHLGKLYLDTRRAGVVKFEMAGNRLAEIVIQRRPEFESVAVVVRAQVRFDLNG